MRTISETNETNEDKDFNFKDHVTDSPPELQSLCKIWKAIRKDIHKEDQSVGSIALHLLEFLSYLSPDGI